MTPTETAWDLYAQALNARDIAVEHARERVERQYRGIIEMRRAAFMAAVDREQLAPASLHKVQLSEQPQCP